jgi:hypothetical protein
VLVDSANSSRAHPAALAPGENKAERNDKDEVEQQAGSHGSVSSMLFRQCATRPPGRRRPNVAPDAMVVKPDVTAGPARASAAADQHRMRTMTGSEAPARAGRAHAHARRRNIVEVTVVGWMVAIRGSEG